MRRFGSEFGQTGQPVVAKRGLGAHSLANLDRWRSQGTWVPAYDVSARLMRAASDEELLACPDATSIRTKFGNLQP